MFDYLVLSESLKLPMYNLWIAAGLIAGFLFLEKQLFKYSISEKEQKKIYIAIASSIPFGFFGARAFDSWVTGVGLLYGGFTFFGGFLSASFCFLLLLRIFKLKIINTLNILVPSLALAHAFGRIGCFFGGCCHGSATHSFLGVIFPQNSPADLLYGQNPVHPTQLYEAFFLFILFILLIWKVPFRFRTSFYLIGYGIFRFLIEELRGDPRGILLTQTLFSPSQLISLALFLIGVVLFFKNKTSASC
ncbi:MAG: hypothetical protein A2Y41_08325 [Spirochaetes bacterium GWB1_36_13]|nr:MAG: hypothetical protein A2Y41_08325 [Spirochaetes bacterium GWB1_36_13]